MEIGSSRVWMSLVVLAMLLVSFSPGAFAQAPADQRILSFSVAGISLDVAETIEVLVNNIPYGYLVTDVSNQLDDEQIACVDVSDLTANVGDNQIVLKEKQSGDTWTALDFSVTAVPDGESCTASVSAYLPLPPNPDRLQGSSRAYGTPYDQSSASAVPVSFTLNQQNPTPATYDSTGVRRDVRVKFNTKHGTISSASNRTIISVNGIQRQVTELYATGAERSYNFIINRNFLNPGINTIEFQPQFTGASKPWGIRNISIEYIEPINLIVGVPDPLLYGYSETPTRFTGLRVNFNLAETSSDYSLSVTAGAISNSDENQVFLNGNSIGFLTPGGNGFNQGDQFMLPQSALIPGNNQIEFVQRYPGGTWSGISREPWSVKDLQLSISTPDLAIAGVEILDRIIRQNSPFQVSVTVANNGSGTAAASTLRFYASTDTAFSLSDTLIFTAPLASIDPAAMITNLLSIQSTLVNKGLFLVVCANVVNNESITANNCSIGIPLKGIAVVPLMLILGQ